MAKYRVLQRFKNLETHAIYEQGQEIELTVERADKAIENLGKYEGDFLERTDVEPVEEEKTDEKAEGKEEVEVIEEKKEAKAKTVKAKEGK